MQVSRSVHWRESEYIFLRCSLQLLTFFPRGNGINFPGISIFSGHLFFFSPIPGEKEKFEVFETDKSSLSLSTNSSLHNCQR